MIIIKIPNDFKDYINKEYLINHQSVRMIARHYNVDHSTISRWMKSIGIIPLTKNESAKYTWVNHAHPNIGKRGELSYMYGRHLSEETKAKLSAANKGDKNARWSGGVKKHSYGYTLIYYPEHPYADRQGFVLEHRIVMESYLGRYLKSNEIVHHINGDKSDNRIENLQLMNRASHAQYHMYERINKNA